MLGHRMRRVTGADFYPHKIDQSCRFNDDDSATIHLAAPTDGNQKTRTFSCWVKRCNLGINSAIVEADGTGGYREVIWFNTNDKLNWQFMINANTQFLLTTEQVFRDVGSWYHLVFTLDTTLVASADHTTIYCNGEEITNWTTLTQLSAQNVDTDLFFESTIQTTFGKYTAAATYGDMYLSEVQVIEGQALTPDEFGESKYGIWIPKKYTGSYGTNGFHLDFADSAALGNDVSGNNNDYATSGLAANDQVLDSPTNNYPIGNHLVRNIKFTYSDGNLTVKQTDAAGAWTSFYGSGLLPLTKGKWYWEVTELGLNCSIGIADSEDIYNSVSTYLGARNNDYGYVHTGNVYNGILGGQAYGNGYLLNDVIGVMLDLDNKTLSFTENGVDQGIAFSNLSGSFVPGFSTYALNDEVDINFGQLSFAYTLPTGYKPLCSSNILTPNIKDSATGFDVVLYEGNATVRDITDLNFDISAGGLVWIKNRDAADEHKLIDTVRGATKELSSDSIVVESTDANGLTAFLSNGFSLGTGANGYNDNLESFVAWCFRKGSKYGFDIQPYTGTGVAHTINHNLGSVPELMIIKNLDGIVNWNVYHHYALNKTDPETDYGVLNLTSAWADTNTVWNDTAPTSTQFTVGTANTINYNGSDYIAYLWRSIEGFSKVFSYTGNGNANGPFVYCGFRPRYILIKMATGSGDWILHDAERISYNPVSERLFANSNSAEVTGTYYIDILSNGFKIRNGSALWNTNAALYVGIAYAEAPGKWSNAR